MFHRGGRGLATGLMFAVCGAFCSRSATGADDPGARPITFEDAVALYKSGDMAGANRDFLLLANAGLATADMNLSVMAARGDAGAPDLGAALGWLTAAQQLGAQVSDAQLHELDGAVGAAGKSRADAIVAHYGRVAVGQRLKEALADCSTSSSRPAGVSPVTTPHEDWTPPKMLDLPNDLPNMYPTKGLEEGLPGAVIVRAWIDVDGRAKHLMVDASFPLGWRLGFQESALETLLRGKFSPATLNGQPIGAWKFMTIRFRPAMQSEMMRAGAIPKLHAAAASGDPVGEALWVVLSRLGLARDFARDAGLTDYNDILVSSALRGFAESEAELSQRLCVPQDRSVWRLRAASDGAVSVLALMIESAYDRILEPYERAQIMRLLDKAATAGDPTLARKVVWIRAAARDPGLRDAHGAVQLGWSLLPDKRLDPDYALAYAAALAASSNFPGARDTQQRAIDKAKRLGWDLAPLQATLKKYQSGEMDSAVPAEFWQVLQLKPATHD